MNSKLIRKETGKDPLYRTWHTNTRALFLFVHSGSGSLVTKEATYAIEENALILIAPGTYHYTMPDDSALYIRSKLVLAPSKFEGLATLLGPQDALHAIFGKSVVYAQIPETLYNTVDQIYAETEECSCNGNHTAILLSCALRLLHYIHIYATESATTSVGIMSKAISYINENISQDLTLDSICATVNISKYHFCRQFKRQLGITVMQYILNTRVILAMDDLAKSNDQISQISERYGFSSVSYFCQVFKTSVGCTPLQYRKKLQSEN